MHPHSTQKRQRGFALMLVLILLIVGISTAIVSGLNSGKSSNFDLVDNETRGNLDSTKSALLIWGSSRDVRLGVSPGLLPYPNTNLNRFLPPTNPATSVCGTAAATSVGRIALGGDGPNCRTRGILSNSTLFQNSFDSTGETLWYAASQNLLDNNIAANPPNSAPPLQRVSTALLTGTTPFPWLTICDEMGNTLTTQAAFVVIAPMGPTAGQSRTATSPNAAQYLDSMTLSGNAPCNGQIRNSVNNQRFLALQGKPTNTFNDRLVYVTAQQHLGMAATAVVNDIAGQLRLVGSLPANRAALREVTGLPQYLVPVSPFTATLPNTFTFSGTVVPNASRHTFVNGDVVRLSNIGGTLPAPFATATNYHVVNVNGPRTTFQLASSPAGPAIPLTNTGTGQTFVGRAADDPQGWFSQLNYNLINATSATITFNNCALVFNLSTVNWGAANGGNGVTRNGNTC